MAAGAGNQNRYAGKRKQTCKELFLIEMDQVVPWNGLVTATNVADITQVDKLLHGQENVVCADAGYTGVEKRPEHEGCRVICQIAVRRSPYKKHGKRSALYKTLRKIEKAKAQVRRRSSIHSE